MFRVEHFTEGLTEICEILDIPNWGISNHVNEPCPTHSFNPILKMGKQTTEEQRYGLVYIRLHNW